MSIEPGDKIRRREWTTKGADPTVVVEWTIVLPNGSIEVTEFQGIYRGNHQLDYGDTRATADLKEDVAEHIHKALEAKWQAEAMKRGWDAVDEVVKDAERKAGWDPNP